MSSGNYMEAVTEFEASYRMDPGVGTQLNLALAEEKLGRHVAAATHLDQVMERLPQGDERIAIATDALTRLNGIVPTLTLRVTPSFPKDLQTFIDGTLAVSKATLRVAAGEHTVQLVSAEIGTGRAQLSCIVGTPCIAEITLSTRATPSAGSMATTEPSSGSGLRTVGFVALGVGGVAAIAGTVFGLMAQSKNSEAREGCTQDLGCPTSKSYADREAALSSGRDHAGVSTGLFIGAGVFALGGLALVLFAPSRAAHLGFTQQRSALLPTFHVAF